VNNGHPDHLFLSGDGTLRVGALGGVLHVNFAPPAPDVARREELIRAVATRSIERNNIALAILHHAATHRIAAPPANEFGDDDRADGVAGDVALAFAYADEFLERSRVDRVALAREVGLDPARDLGASFGWPFARKESR
jgi:hypothetical protein